LELALELRNSAHLFMQLRLHSCERHLLLEELFRQLTEQLPVLAGVSSAEELLRERPRPLTGRLLAPKPIDALLQPAGGGRLPAHAF